MSEPAATEDEIAHYAEAAARLLGLPVPDERRAAVLEHFRLAHRLAGVVEAWPLGPADEAAPVFQP
jgi:hypothetical protein